MRRYTNPRLPLPLPMPPPTTTGKHYRVFRWSLTSIQHGATSLRLVDGVEWNLA